MKNTNKKKLLPFALMVFLIIFSFEIASALPAIPGAKGFGMSTPAGRGGQVIKVTNLNPDGPGSLKAAIDAEGARTVVFEISGTIRIDDTLRIRNPFITIAGQTAPSPGITLRGTNLAINTHDVLIQHIRSRAGDVEPGVFPDYRDGVTVGAGAYNIVIDHCSFSWGIDETASIWGADIYNVTYSNCIVSEGLEDSLHPKGPHSKGLIIGDKVRKIAVIQNLIAHCRDRNPYITDVEVIVINNIAYNGGWFNTMIQNVRGPVNASIVGNVGIPGPNSTSVVANSVLTLWSPPNWEWYGSPSGQGSSIYLYDNLCNAGTQKDPNDWDLVDNPHNLNISVFKVLSPPIWIDGLSPMPSEKVEEYITSNAGARPADRDSVDKRIINDLISRSGKIINSQYDVGGWPELKVNIVILDIPNNPTGDDNGDGYTNLEEWLHRFSSNVESTLQVPQDLRIK